MNYIEIVKKFLNKYSNAINVLFFLSAMTCTVVLSLNYSVLIKYDGYIGNSYYVKPLYAFIAVCVMLPVYYFVIYRKSLLNKIIEKMNMKLMCIDLFFTFSIAIKLASDTKRNYSHIIESSLGKILQNKVIESHTEHFVLLCCLFCSIAIFFVLMYLINIINDIVKEVLPLAAFEKKYFIIVFSMSVFAILYFYQRANGQWAGLDLVYQNDAIFLYDHYYPVFSFGYDFDWDIGNGGIRHPLATLITFPIYVIVSVVSIVFFFVPNITAILYAMTNVILLIFTAVLLVRVTNNKWLFPIFTLINPFMFYMIFLEKYQMAVFLAVLFMYLVKNKSCKTNQGTVLIASSGIMITSAFCGFAYGEEKKLKNRFKEYIVIFSTFLLVLIGTGRISYLLNFMYLKEQNYLMFFKGTRFEKICSYSNMIVSCFVPIPYEATEKNLSWSTYNTRFNYLSIIILALIIIAFVKHYKRIEVKIFMLWIILSFLQFLLGSNSPLFNLYYAWAFVPMTLLGMETLIKNKKVINISYVILAIILFYSNFSHMKDVLDYLVLKTPV